jgi:acetoin:2,6-dichlorophenolindophenol oxidoreductase subunit beta
MSTVLESLNTALHSALAADQRVVILGEDILDPYGGAFKVTRGLSSVFPERVLTSPVSEAGIVGIASGMAIRGLRPVVEIMFGDFITLAADQLINHVSKFRFMYNEQVLVPLVIRTPMGGRRGYGPTHSQSLEKIFMGVPGLRVLAVNPFDDPGKRLLHLILEEEEPTLFIENKLLYTFSIHDSKTLSDFEVSKSETGLTYTLAIAGAPTAALTIIAYGYMAELCRQAALRLAYEHEIFVELTIPTQLSPFEISPMLDSATRTRHLLVVEEGTLTLGWGAEILASIVERLPAQLYMSRRLAAADSPIPASAPLEAAILPDIDRIIATAKTMV